MNEKCLERGDLFLAIRSSQPRLIGDWQMQSRDLVLEAARIASPFAVYSARGSRVPTLVLREARRTIDGNFASQLAARRAETATSTGTLGELLSEDRRDRNS